MDSKTNSLPASLEKDLQPVDIPTASSSVRGKIAEKTASLMDPELLIARFNDPEYWRDEAFLRTIRRLVVPENKGHWTIFLKLLEEEFLRTSETPAEHAKIEKFYDQAAEDISQRLKQQIDASGLSLTRAIDRSFEKIDRKVRERIKNISHDGLDEMDRVIAAPGSKIGFGPKRRLEEVINGWHIYVADPKANRSPETEAELMGNPIVMGYVRLKRAKKMLRNMATHYEHQFNTTSTTEKTLAQKILSILTLRTQ